MTSSNNPMQTINWKESLPWLIIFRTFSVAFSPTAILLAFVGALITPIGWFMSDLVFISKDMKLSAVDSHQTHLVHFVERMRSPHKNVFESELTSDPETGETDSAMDYVKKGQPAAAFDQLSMPFRGLFSESTPGFRVYLYLFFGSMWTLAVWAFLGCGICRSAVLKFTRDEPLNPVEAIQFSIKSFVSSASAIGIPIICVFLLTIPGVLAGWLLLSNVGTVIGGLGWFIILGCGFVMALLLVGLFFSWPLMIASVSTEEQDGFDAMSKGYAYLFARPLSFLFYVLLALGFGGFCYWIVVILIGFTIDLSKWSVSWGATLSDPPDFKKVEKPGDEDDDDDENPKTKRLNEIFVRADESRTIEKLQNEAAAIRAGKDYEDEEEDDDTSGALKAGRGLIWFWVSGLKTFGAAFVYSLFWCLASAVYLVLRKDIDDVEMDEVSIQEEKRSYELPQLKTSESQPVPQLQQIEPNPSEESDGSDDPSAGESENSDKSPDK